MHTTAEFTLGRDDFIRFQRLSARRLLASKDVQVIQIGSKIVVWLILVASLFIAFRAADRHPAEAAALYVMAALFGAAIVLTRMLPHLLSLRLRRRVIADGGAFLRTHAIEFSDAGLSVRWHTGRAENSWSDFLCRDADPVNHYLYVDGCAAVIVPRHAVAPFQSDFERYVASIPAA